MDIRPPPVANPEIIGAGLDSGSSGHSRRSRRPNGSESSRGVLPPPPPRAPPTDVRPTGRQHYDGLPSAVPEGKTANGTTLCAQYARGERVALGSVNLLES